jgi:RNA polymerase sigma-70 factor (ECF subfamily)
MTGEVEAALAEAHRLHWATLLARATRLTRDFDSAEDVVQDAFASALWAWPREGIPRNCLAWLTAAAHRKAIDRRRRDQTLQRKLPLLVTDDDEFAPSPLTEDGETTRPYEVSAVRDERLRMIFTCCHPALAIEARVALTLRLVCGLNVAEIARLFLVSESTMAARLMRAKHKIRGAGIPFRVPADHELPSRLPAVLASVWLLYTEGHTAGSGSELRRPRLTTMAIELARLLVELMPDEPEVLGLLALLRLSDARQGGRIDEHGQLVLLADQDRTHWDRAAVAHGRDLVTHALRLAHGRAAGAYTLQAAIAAVHAEAPTSDATDWRQIVALYDALLVGFPSPVAALARAVALGMRDGPAAALAEIERLVCAEPTLRNYHPAHVARAEMLRRLGRASDADMAYAVALESTANEVEQASLRRQRAELLSLRDR